MKAKSSIPEVVVRNGKPVAVILGINQYEALLERLEDVEDLKELAAMRRKPLKYKKLEEFLKESLARRLEEEESAALFDAFTLVGEDSEEASVDYAHEAQRKVVLKGE